MGTVLQMGRVAWTAVAATVAVAWVTGGGHGGQLLDILSLSRYKICP